MNTILAILALTVFIISIPLFLFNSDKLVEKSAIRSKMLKDIDKEIALAKNEGNPEKADRLKKEKQNMSLGMLGNALLDASGCCLALFVEIGHLVMKVIVIVAALTRGVGNPLYGYIALAIIAALFMNGFLFVSKKVARERAEAEALGIVYVMKTNWVVKILGTVPSIYALYIFLVLIGAAL